MVKIALDVRERLKRNGYACSLTNARFVKPIDTEAIEEGCKNHKLLVTLEENVLSGGYGEKVRAYVDSIEAPVRILHIAIPDEYVEHGNVDILRREIGIDAETITDRILDCCEACGIRKETAESESKR